MAKCTSYCALDVAGFLLLFVLEGLLWFGVVPPLKRTVYCHDQTIQQPLRPQTISIVALLVIVFAIAALIIVVEILFKRNQDKHNEEVLKFACLPLRPWHRRLLFITAMYFYGGTVGMFFTDLVKRMVGRLRPNFLAICTPHAHLNCTQPISDSDCTGDPFWISQGRTSFPSGHSSIITFCAVFFALYVETRIRTRRTALLKPCVQILALGLAVFVSMSRVYDFYHHVTDVLAGMAIGATVAVYIVLKPLELFDQSDPARCQHGKNNNYLTECAPYDENTAPLEHQV
ncbi:phospholipid phosphatase 2 [Nematostella vectensis]|uniref:phospholipid phosphatase 2 n=1 Tax=Nematostella vectensis TaxID=45351 RepID=UPI002076FF11|nr:phospholipid phosphatase 2 [Nematostella vectensis]